jgi:hypothetical protein
MNRVLIAVAGLYLLLGSPAAAFAQCPTNGVNLTHGQSLLVTADCSVTGNVTLSGTSLLLVSDSRFVLRGDLNVGGNGVVIVYRSDFIVDNEVSNQFGIKLSGAAVLWFHLTNFQASQKTDGNYFASYEGRNTSKLLVTDSVLDTDHSWMLSRFIDSSSVTLSNSNNFPSEITVENQASARIQAGSITAMWLPFDPGTRGTMLLPDQSAGNYSFEFGRRTAGVVGIGYDVVIQNSLVRLGVNSRPSSQAVIVGRGKSNPSGGGEISIGYSMDGVVTPQTLTGLRPGYQVFTQLTHQGRQLILFNVDLDPVAWSVWVATSTAPVIISDSVLNEVATWGGPIEVDRSILQWAVLGAIGNTASVVVRNSSVHSQLIYATLGGQVQIEDSIVHGSPLSANADSLVSITGGAMEQSGAATPCDLHDGLTDSYVPLCNPFVPPGIDSTVRTAGNGQVTIDPTPPAATSDLILVGSSEPQTIAPGGTFAYHLQAGNFGPDPATNVVVHIKTPLLATVQSFPAFCALSGRDVSCPLGNLPLFVPSEVLIITYQGVAYPLTPVVGEATVRSDQFDPDWSNHLVRIATAVQ